MVVDHRNPTGLRDHPARWIAQLLCLLLCSTSLMAGEVTAKLDRNRIVEGETVTLVLQTDDPGQNLDTDLGVLEDDFSILDRRSETQMSILNGKQTAQVRLLLVLEPRRSGMLKIPALNLGDSGTEAISLRVDPAPEPEPGEAPPVFIEVSLTPENGPWYVHAQLGLNVRVFYQQNLTEAAISQPEPQPASVRLLDEVPFQAERNGVRYRVLERHYAIFPERSGHLLIPPLQLTGRLVERRADRLWQPAVRGRRIRVESEAIELDIQPKPVNFSGSDWLPARNLEITQQISAADELRVGEPVTRTVIIDVLGLEENMITEPAWPEIADARIYPDQPQGISRDDGHWVLGHKEFRYAVVPEAEGELELPELLVHWWDTVNDRQRTATLPASKLQVKASALVTPPQPPAVTDASRAPTLLPGGSDGLAQPGYWRWLALTFAALWLLTMALFLSVHRQSPGRIKEASGGQPNPESELLRQLKNACGRNQTGDARRALAAWLSGFGPHGTSGSLLEFAAGLEQETLRDSIYALDAEGFRPDGEISWDGKAFWKQFESWRKSTFVTDGAGNPSVIDLYARDNR